MKKKTHEEYELELNQKNPLVKVMEEYINYNTPIKHKCSVCGKEDWLITPSNVLKGTIMCSSCNRHWNNSFFAEIAQQYLENIGVAKVEYDLGYKNLSFYDLYIPSKNLIIEIQSEYHDDKLEFDLDKKKFAEDKGYTVEWIDIRNTNILDFLKRFDASVNFKKIYQNIDMSQIRDAVKIVQLDLNGDLIKVWGGISEIYTTLGYTISRISTASRGINYKFQHFYKNYLWYTYNDYIKLDKKDIQSVTEDILERYNVKEGNYLYIAQKDNEIITSDSLQELTDKINSSKGLVCSCIKGTRNHTKGYKITRVLKV